MGFFSFAVHTHEIEIFGTRVNVSVEHTAFVHLHLNPAYPPKIS